MVASLVRGLVLGFVCGIPVGPVNAAVIDTAMRRCLRRAIFLGLGGAFVDFAYSQIASAGLGTLMARVPGLNTAFLGVGGLVLLILGVKAVQAPAIPVAAAANVRLLKRALVASFLVGVLLTVMNPAALVSWVLLAGTVLADVHGGEMVVAGVGIFAGTAAWFVLIAWLASKGRVRLGDRAVWVTRGVGALLIVYGVFLVAKASYVVYGSTP